MATPVKAGQAYVALGIQDNLDKGLRDAKRKLQRFGRGLMAIGRKLVTISGAIITAFVLAAGKFADFGDTLAKTAGKLGMTVESLQKLQYAALRGGLQINQLNMSLQRMVRRVSEAAKGSGAAKKAFEEMGLDPKTLAAKPVAEQLGAIGDALAKVGNDSDKVRLAFAIFDSEGVGMLNVLRDGSAGLAAMGTEAEKLGIILGGDAAKMAAAFTDAWTDLKLQLKAIVIQIGSAVAPMLQGLVEIVGPIIKRTIDWIKANKRLATVLLSAAGVALFVGGSLIALGGIFVVVGTILSTLVGWVFSAISALLHFAMIPQLIMRIWSLFTGLLGIMKSLAGVAVWLGKILLSALASVASKVGTVLFNVLSKAIPAFVQFVSNAARIITVEFARMFSGIGRFFTQHMPGLASMFKRFIVRVSGGFRATFNALKVQFKLFANTVKWVWGQFKAGMIGAKTMVFKLWSAFKFLVKGVKGSFRALRNLIKNETGDFVAHAMHVVKMFWKFFTKAPFRAIKVLAKGIASLAMTIMQPFINIAKAIPGLFFAALGIITGFFKTTWDYIVSGFKAAVSGVKSAVNTLVDIFWTVIEGIGVTFVQLWNVVQGGAVTVVNNLGMIFSGLLGQLTSAFSEMGGTFKSMWHGIVAAITTGDFNKALEIILTGGQVALLQFSDAVIDAWLQMNVNLVNFAQKTANKMIGIWRKASQKIASWLADRFYEWSVGGENVLTEEERQRMKKGSLDTTYDKWEKGLTGSVDDFAAESREFWKNWKEERQPEAKARVDALQGQLNALRGDAERAAKDANDARKEVSAKGYLPDMDLEGIGEGMARAQKDAQAQTLERGSVEAARKANELMKQQTSYQQRLIDRMEQQIKILREMRDKPGVGVA